MNNEDLVKILNFSHEIYKVKNLLRYKGMPGWENDNIERWDSVAEHSYRMALMAVMISPYLEEKINLEKVLKMILIHDIVEILALDYSPIGSHGNGGGHAFNENAFQEKYKREMTAAENIFKNLPNDLYKDFLGLFTEYISTKADEKNATNEGRLAYALDKIEATVQIIDWRKESKNWEINNFTKQMEYMHKWADYDLNLKNLANLVEIEAKKLIQ
jgi:putative hydrolases of HD superfamily